MVLYDLHTHSSASDGEYSPSVLAEKVKNAGISVWALTDHDTVDGCQEAAEAAEKLGIQFIPGVECTCKGHRHFHILGLGIDINSTELKNALNELAESRMLCAEKICAVLREKGLDIQLDDVLKYADGGSVGKPHIGRVMIDKGYVSEMEEAFQKYFETPEIKSIKKKKLTSKEAVDLIHSAGGIAVLAHPYQLGIEPELLHDFVGNLKNDGLDGIECWYSKFTEEMMETYIGFAEEFGLLKSIGSDFHGGKSKPDISLGTGRYNSIITLREKHDFDGEILKVLLD
ncbi:MAG: PHP domain-containing protein [Ruminococcus sp.]|nr:PHP domain-containing protein [Ruminococcus sp.]